MASALERRALSPATGLITRDDQGWMSQITQDNTISYGSLTEAYTAPMTQALDDNHAAYGTDITDQQYGLVQGGAQVIGAITSAT